MGVLFLVMAAGRWRRHPKQGEASERPRWMAMIDRFGPGKSLGLGAVLSGANGERPDRPVRPRTAHLATALTGRCWPRAGRTAGVLRRRSDLR